MPTRISMDTSVSLRQAFLVMFAYLEQHWESVGKPDAIGDLLSELSLWNAAAGEKEPIDAAVLPQWLQSASKVLAAEATSDGYRGADVQLVGKKPAA